ncbi:MAG: phosphoribosylanthranilate isomerase [Alphaproteobacteria bacterium]|nr:phosphoribosylanthranilate isomerase [Alphaproteobacteria bacterium]
MQVKICGLSEIRHIEAAAKGGARYVGFVFFPKSPRYVSIEAAHDLMLAVPEGICKVALVVDADDGLLSELTDRLPIDMLQLHGDETPERVAQIREVCGLPVMKAVGVADESDLPALADYARVADQILVDAKPPKNAELPGGNGLSFDWRLIAGRRWAVPWMLAGGLTPDNVAEAAHLTGAQVVDVSSGVESGPGMKDSARIAAFLAAAAT